MSENSRKSKGSSGQGQDIRKVRISLQKSIELFQKGLESYRRSVEKLLLKELEKSVSNFRGAVEKEFSKSLENARLDFVRATKEAIGDFQHQLNYSVSAFKERIRAIESEREGRSSLLLLVVFLFGVLAGVMGTVGVYWIGVHWGSKDFYGEEFFCRKYLIYQDGEKWAIEKGYFCVPVSPLWTPPAQRSEK